MGHGIAQVAAAAGYRVIMRDVDRGALARGVQAIERNLAKGIQLAKLTEADRDETLQRIRGTTSLAETKSADLIIEAAPERLDLKQQILSELETIALHPFIFATNTSSLSITELARVSRSPDRVVGMHFFNPVHIMRLVEIVVGKATSDETVETVLAGVASASDIDKAMELGYNHPMGPLRLTDHIGLDVRLNIAEYLHRELGTETFRPPEVLRRMVSEGKLGKKTGEGFYRWNGEKEDARRAHLSV